MKPVSSIPSRLKTPIKRAFLGLWTTLALLFVWSVGTPTLHAEISVAASVDPNVTVAGDPVQLIVTVNGSHEVQTPPDVRVEGAQVQFLGPQTQTSIINGQVSIAVSYRYYLVPQKTGDLQIPSVQIAVGGGVYATQPLTLKVLEAGQNAVPEPNQGAFIEVQVPRAQLYEGESIAAELSILVPTDIRWRLEAVDFTSDSFLKTQLQRPQQRIEKRNGKDYEIVAYRSMLTAIRSGDVPLGELSFRVSMETQRKKKNRGNSPFGGIFGGAFDGFPFDMQPAVMQERTIKYGDGRLKVLPLPPEGKPESFRGAVGHFSFSATTNQSKIKAGEPLTITLQVEGQGNLDRIEVPPLLNPEGWRVYPPETSVTKADDIGQRGAKTFRLAVVPEAPQKQTPQFVFSYFDPETAKYVTQVSNPSPLEVTGSLPQPEKEAPAPSTSKAAEKKAPKPEASAEMVQAPDSATKGTSPWRPTPLFWTIQSILAASLAALGLARWMSLRRAKLGDAPRLKREAVALHASLRSGKEAPAFFRNSVRVLQLLASIKNGKPAAALGFAEIRTALALDEPTAAELQWLFDRDASLRFGGGVSDGIPDADRSRVLKLLGEFLS